MPVVRILAICTNRYKEAFHTISECLVVLKIMYK